MSDSFYSAFENRHRGSRELIKSRLAVYLPFIRPLAALCPQGSALDLGCGRGEWLELLSEHGFDAVGVDLDDGMLAACQQHRLNARNADALKTLQDLPSASQALVSAFHLVEHLPFDQVKTLVQEALRVLKPGGLLILETPNPENLVVGATSFYMDPSHLHPLPPELLDFVAEHAGFQHHKVVRLQESVDLQTPSAIGVFGVLHGASADYAVVAQKAATPEVLAGFAAPFQARYGVSLGSLARLYDAQAQQRIEHSDQQIVQAEARFRVSVNQAEARAAQAEVSANQAEARASQAEVKANQAEAQAARAEVSGNLAEARAAQVEVKIHQIEVLAVQLEMISQQTLAHSTQAEERAIQAESRSIQAEAHAAQLAAQLDALFRSHSWRITAPLRLIARNCRRLGSAIRERRLIGGIKRRVKPSLRRLGQAVLRRPRLTQLVLDVLNRFPGLKFRLRNMMLGPTLASIGQSPETPHTKHSARTLRILAELKRAIAARND